MGLGLIGDIGGTNARFALVDNASAQPWSSPRTLAVADYPSLAEAAEAYLSGLEHDGLLPTTRRSRLREAAFCVASAIDGDRVRFTNSPWSFSIADCRQQLRLAALTVENDFAANARAVPFLTAQDWVAVGDPRPEADSGDDKTFARASQPIAVIGPGTGLGVSVLLPPDPACHRSGWLALPTEGGHVTLAGCSAAEDAVIARARQDFPHVSAERLVCGAGLSLLYRLLAPQSPPQSPPSITEAALAGTDPIAQEVVALFCAFLGTTAGNLVLTTGAKGGVVLMGGILPRLLPLLPQTDFRCRFESKGRFHDYLRPLPTVVTTHPTPAFLGLRSLLTRFVAADDAESTDFDGKRLHRRS